MPHHPESDGDFLSQVHAERLEFCPLWSSERDFGNSISAQEYFRACCNVCLNCLHRVVFVPCSGSDYSALPVPVRSCAELCDGGAAACSDLESCNCRGKRHSGSNLVAVGFSLEEDSSGGGSLSRSHFCRDV